MLLLLIIVNVSHDSCHDLQSASTERTRYLSQKSCNQHQRVIIRSGVVLKQVLSNGDDRLTQDIELAFEARSRLQTIREHYKNGTRCSHRLLSSGSLFWKLAGAEHKRCSGEKVSIPEVI